MSKISHVLVTAAEGRLVPIPASEASAAGGAILKIEPGKVYRLLWSTYTRKRITGGDLVLVDAKSKKPPGPKDPPVLPELAAVDETLKLAPDGTVDSDQRSDDEINAAAAAAAKASTPRKDA